MNKETMARDYSTRQDEDGTVYIDAASEFDFLAGFEAGQAQLLEQASDGFEEWAIREDRHDGLFSNANSYTYFARKGWQASALHSAKLLAERDKEIEKLKRELKDRLVLASKAIAEKDKELKEMRKHIEFQSQVMVDMGGVVLENKKLEAGLKEAKELIKEMRDALGFYANWCNTAGAQIIEDDTEIIHMINPLAKDSRGVLIGGKLARKTLKENTDKIKALLGEE